MPNPPYTTTPIPGIKETVFHYIIVSKGYSSIRILAHEILRNRKEKKKKTNYV